MRAAQAVRAVPVQSEASFAREFEHWATCFRWDYYHTFDSRRSTAGFPDYVLWRGERTLFVELKADDGRSTPEQKAVQRGLAGNPHVEVFCFRPRDWAEIMRVLR